jgi:hypothetical protein
MFFFMDILSWTATIGTQDSVSVGGSKVPAAAKLGAPAAKSVAQPASKSDKDHADDP